MKELKEKIERDGLAVGTGILKVDSFLNHQIDVEFLEKVGENFALRFKDCKIDKILTVEASGIAVACIAAKNLDYPKVLFAKKTEPNTMVEDCYLSEVVSFTKKNKSLIRIAKQYLKAGEKVLILDDFMAHGEAALGMVDLVEQAGAEVAGIGIVIEKKFQGGGDKIRKAGYKLESLAMIKEIKDGKVEFC